MITELLAFLGVEGFVATVSEFFLLVGALGFVYNLVHKGK